MQPINPWLVWLKAHAPSALLLLLLLLLVAGASAGGSYGGQYLASSSLGSENGTTSGHTHDGKDAGNCNVVGLNIHGCIYTYAPDSSSDSGSVTTSGCDAITSSEDIVARIEQAKNDPSVKAILLDVDSGGGQPQAAIEISDALKSTGKPTIAWIRGYGDSAAYWLSSAAGTVIASKESDVGSIGVTSSYVDNSKQNASQGLTYNQLTTGKFKDTGSRDKPLGPDERKLLEAQLQVTYEDFIQSVADNRHLSVEKVRSIADGSTMLGADALAFGLIDKLGTKNEVWAELESKIKEKPEVCWPQYQ